MEYAHHKAVRLGAQVLNSDTLAKIGEEMQRLPLDPNYARMLVESRRFGKKIELLAAAMVSACQYDGITMTEQGCEQWKTLTNEDRSDILAQLDVFVKSTGMSEEELRRFNIVEQRLVKARRLFERLCDDEGLNIGDLKLPTEEEREKLIGCIIAGCDTLFLARGNTYSNDEGFEGRLAKSTKINPGIADLVVGTPFILEHYRNQILKSHSIIVNGTAVTAQQLMEYAPWRCDFNGDRLFVDNHGNVRKARELYFDGKAIHRSVEEDVEPSFETTKVLLEKLFYDEQLIEKMSPKTKTIYHEIERLRDLLIDRSNKTADYEWIIETLTQNISGWKDVRVNDMYSLVEILHKRKVHTRLKMTLSADSYETEAILKNSPDQILVDTGSEIVEAKVTYKQNKAFIELPTHLVKYLEGVEEELGGRHVYVWTDSTKKNYLTLHKAIEKSNSGDNRAARREASRKNRNGNK
jgi:HrpA-like RNA helicase